MGVAEREIVGVSEGFLEKNIQVAKPTGMATSKAGVRRRQPF